MIHFSRHFMCNTHQVVELELCLKYLRVVLQLRLFSVSQILWGQNDARRVGWQLNPLLASQAFSFMFMLRPSFTAVIQHHTAMYLMDFWWFVCSDCFSPAPQHGSSGQHRSPWFSESWDLEQYDCDECDKHKLHKRRGPSLKPAALTCTGTCCGW